MGRLAQVIDEHTTDKCKTFVFMGEGYSLGNSLVTCISLNPDVEFVACFINHPAENNIYVRIQAKNGSVIDILKKGLEDFEQVCDHTLKTFEDAYRNYRGIPGGEEGNEVDSVTSYD